MSSSILLKCSTVWEVWETPLLRDQGGMSHQGARVLVRRAKNIHTNTGLTAYASGFQGSYPAPVYLVIENLFAKLQAASGSGATSVSSDLRLALAGASS